MDGSQSNSSLITLQKKSIRISIEIEKSNQGFEDLIPYADVIFISKDVSESNCASTLKEALEFFKRYVHKHI